MYTKLKILGLEKYICNFCGGSIQQNKYFNKIENFIDTLSTKNFSVLELKFKGNKNFSEIADLLHEIEIACLFHPKATFNNDAPDLEENGIGIEVKSLNEGKEEQDRHKSNKFLSISKTLTYNKNFEEKNNTVDAIKNKINYHLKKADDQLKGKGLIYLIWDYNLLLHSADGGIHKGTVDKEEMNRIISEYVDEFIKNHSCLNIKHYYFGDIIEMIENQADSLAPRLSP
jgi:hypothetical protein